jgi:hypothetical protein
VACKLAVGFLQLGLLRAGGGLLRLFVRFGLEAGLGERGGLLVLLLKEAEALSGRRGVLVEIGFGLDNGSFI